MSDKPSIEEITESLTGFDEIAIEKQFGRDLFALQEKPTTMMRALAFVIKKRTGLTDPQAYEAAMTLTMREVNEEFDLDGEVDEEDPITESGKGSEPVA